MKTNELTDAQLDTVVGGGVLGDAWNWVKNKVAPAVPGILKKLGDILRNPPRGPGRL